MFVQIRQLAHPVLFVTLFFTFCFSAGAALAEETFPAGGGLSDSRFLTLIIVLICLLFVCALACTIAATLRTYKQKPAEGGARPAVNCK